MPKEKKRLNQLKTMKKEQGKTTQKILVSTLKLNPRNPRKISKSNLKKLASSLEKFMEMLEARPIVYDENKMVLGGNQRLLALRHLEIEEIPEKYTLNASGWSDEKKREFVIKDNNQYGEDDWEILSEDWKKEELLMYDKDIDKYKEPKEDESGEIEFSEILEEEQNYIVLTFDNEIDWLSAKTHFGLKTVYSKKSNGKPWSKGIGRVINGADYLKKLKDV